MCFSRVRLLVLFLLASLLLFLTSPLAVQLRLLLRMPFIWQKSAADSIISHDRDAFDVTFRAYDGEQPPSEPPHPSPVPATLHHVHLGGTALRPEWLAAREECLRIHPGWKTHTWDDTAANQFVREHFPELQDTWNSYPYLVQKVDALRYMILYIHGGAILDLDLVCKRSLEPLRRFDFVAPAAYPAGFSIGMLLSAPKNSFVRDLIDNLPRFNRRWFLFPYVTVMFSTGCHYASMIYTTQPNRTSLRILSGPSDNPNLHMLNGFVDTPLFRHLGTSSWHANDALFVRTVEEFGGRVLYCVLSAVVVGGCVVVSLSLAARRRSMRMETPTSPSKVSEKVV
ncbi:glycosyl transferase [Aspergillus nomiae NRRL 13137]|uniref:Glycosyl transferase n=1 Tax=Aspergillus nomiae NRRL (strain ATCC 15546 / NRRL 13137 / CBS 260.88 / M93) TaxID=1509407 RepID=A0A0L1J0P5_ASPN3|nr:glycosyl transferase [Aspergillus nomiae NRRL 13137]KNG85327.1 glycosyl transferase [Aspergillus nomiae NRRL 13137]